MTEEQGKPVRLNLVVQPSHPGFYLMTGALLGAVFEILVAHPLNDFFRNLFAYLISGNPIRWHYLLTHPMSPGEWPAVSLTGLIFGAVLGFVFYRLRENQKRIQGLRQEFEIQVAALRHHYKNLTLGISGFSDRARRKLEKLQEQLSSLPDFVDHTDLEALRRSVLNLLAASKSLSTSLTEELVFLKALQSSDLTPEPQDFFPVLRHAIQELVELRFQDKEIEVKINGKSLDEPTSPLIFAFEPYTMEIVLQNLLSNAMRYGDSIQVTAAASVHKVMIEISDNGPGLELEKIKANLILPDKHRAPESTQLGLRTTLYLLDKSGGQLFARNKPGSGATFILEFPQRAL